MVKSTGSCSTQQNGCIPYEPSQIANIIKQITIYAHQHGYSVTANKSTSDDVPHIKRYSKYASSQPDLSVVKGGAGLFIFHEDLEHEDLDKKMEAMCLHGEAKTSTKAPKDPIGQLLGSLEKSLGDIEVSAFCVKYISSYGKKCKSIQTWRKN